MSWAGMKNLAELDHVQLAANQALTREHRVQEECQPSNDPGDDEDWYGTIRLAHNQSRHLLWLNKALTWAI